MHHLNLYAFCATYSHPIREALILEIFESRASSASKAASKTSQMRYEMSRAKEKVRLARMGEQPGFMGIGRFEVDTYYNDIRHRMNAIKSKLEKSHRQRELHRSGRQRMGWDIVSLAGYTSAGKTTLFNTLTGEQKEQDAKLFTTYPQQLAELNLEVRQFLFQIRWALSVGFLRI